VLKTTRRRGIRPLVAKRIEYKSHYDTM